MTVTAETNSVTHDCNGVLTAFDFTFKVFQTSDVKVILITVATGVETVLDETTHYAVTGALLTGGKVSTVATYSSAYQLMITIDIDLDQETDLTYGGSYSSSSVETMADKLTKIAQQHDEEIGRAIKFKASSDESDIEINDLEASHILAVDAAGTGIEMGLPVEDIESYYDGAVAAQLAAASAAAAAAASAASLNIATPVASKEGALLLQNAADDGYDLLEAQGEAGQVLTSAGANAKPSFQDAGGDTLPVVDTTGIAKGSVDATKIVRLEVDGLTTGTTRVLTVPDKDITIGDVSAAANLTANALIVGEGAKGVKAQPGTFCPDYNEADQGVTGSGLSAKAYIDTISTDSATLVFRHSSGAATTTYTFSTDETIPSNINVVIEKGAILSIDNAITLTINGPFEAGLYQIKDGLGTLMLNGNKTIYSDWWGITYDGATDNSAALQEAIDTITFDPASSGTALRGIVTLGKRGKVAIASGITITGAVQFDAKYSSIIPTANMNMITIQMGGRLRDCILDTSGLATYEGAVIDLTGIHTNYNKGDIRNVYIRGKTPQNTAYTSYGIRCIEDTYARSFFNIDNVRIWCMKYGIYNVPTGTSYITANTYNIDIVDCEFPIYEDDSTRIVAANIYKGTIQPQTTASYIDSMRFESAITNLTIWDTHYLGSGDIQIYGEYGDYIFDLRGVPTSGWYSKIRDYGTYNKIRLNREGTYYDGLGTMEGWTLDWDYNNAFLGKYEFYEDFIGGVDRWDTTAVGASTFAETSAFTMTDTRVLTSGKMTTGATTNNSILAYTKGSSAPFRAGERIKALFEFYIDPQVQYNYRIGLFKDSSNYILLEIDQGAAAVNVNILTKYTTETTTDTGLDSSASVAVRYVLVMDITTSMVNWWLIRDETGGSQVPLSFMYLTAGATQANGTITTNIPIAILQPYVYLKTKEDVAKTAYPCTFHIKGQRFRKIY